MTRTTNAVASGYDHLATALQHLTSYIVDIRTSDTACTTHYNIISGVNTIAASAVSAEQIVPAITIDKVAGLAVDGYVLFLIALDALACRGVKFDEANGAEVSAIACPKASCSGVKQ